MAISSYKTFLMHSTDGTAYAKLIDIKSFPDLGQAPEQLQATSLSDKQHVFVQGIQQTEALAFTANYTLADFNTVNALDDGAIHHFSVWLGGTETQGVPTPTGSEGKYNFDAYCSVYVNGAGVNEIVEMTITLTPTTIVVPSAG